MASSKKRVRGFCTLFSDHFLIIFGCRSAGRHLRWDMSCPHVRMVHLRANERRQLTMTSRVLCFLDPALCACGWTLWLPPSAPLCLLRRSHMDISNITYGQVPFTWLPATGSDGVLVVCCGCRVPHSRSRRCTCRLSCTRRAARTRVRAAAGGRWARAGARCRGRGPARWGQQPHGC